MKHPPWFLGCGIEWFKSGCESEFLQKKNSTSFDHYLRKKVAKPLKVFFPESALLSNQDGFSGTGGPLLVKTNQGFFLNFQKALHQIQMGL